MLDLMWKFGISLVVSVAIGWYVILRAFEDSTSLPFMVPQKDEPFKTFVAFLLRFAPYFSVFLGFNLVLSYLCRLDGHFNEAQKESGWLLYANQVIQNSVESFAVFVTSFLLYCTQGHNVSTRDLNAVCWLFLLGRVLFAVLYYLGFLVGHLYFRTVGVVIQQVVVAIMLLNVFLNVDLLAFLRLPLSLRK